MSSTPPEFYLPIESMPVLANVPYVHDPDTSWLYIIGRVKPGVVMAPLQQKISGLVRQAFAPSKNFSSKQGKESLARTHVVLTPGGAGIEDLQKQYASHLHLLMWIASLVLLTAGGRFAERDTNDRNGSELVAARAGGAAGGAVPGVAGGGRTVFAKPGQIAKHRP